MLPGSDFAVRRTRLPVEAVWTYVEDLERAIPSLDALAGTFDVIDRVDDRIVARVTGSAWSRWGSSLTFGLSRGGTG
jgi:hypothetical protein